MRLYKRVMQPFPSAIAMLILTALCMWLCDLPLASLFAHDLRSNGIYVQAAKIPDVLLMAVVILTSLSWISYFSLIRLNIHDQHTLLCRLTGTVLPLAYGVKAILKWFFGRTEPRTWVSDPNLYGFHWFAGTEGFQAFPSGHMLVLTPLFLVLSNFFPRYRFYYGVGWFCLGAALIATDFHYLSDVLVGAYIGAGVYRIVRRGVG